MSFDELKEKHLKLVAECENVFELLYWGRNVGNVPDLLRAALNQAEVDPAVEESDDSGKIVEVPSEELTIARIGAAVNLLTTEPRWTAFDSLYMAALNFLMNQFRAEENRRTTDELDED